MSEEEIYELISDELESEKVKKGVWTKAFSQADGEENKTRAIYIKLRFEQLSLQKKNEKEDISNKENSQIEETIENEIFKNEYDKKKENNEFVQKLISNEKNIIIKHDADYNKKLAEIHTKNLLDEYGIEYENDFYIYNDFKYRKLEDAINYIKSKKNNPNSFVEKKIQSNNSNYHNKTGNKKIELKTFSGFLKFLKYFIPIDIFLGFIQILRVGKQYNYLGSLGLSHDFLDSSGLLGVLQFQAFIGLASGIFYIYVYMNFLKKKKRFILYISVLIISCRLLFIFSTYLEVQVYKEYDIFIIEDTLKFIIDVYQKPIYIYNYTAGLILLIYFNISSKCKQFFIN